MIALQETWLDEETMNEFRIPGYTLHLNSYGKGKGLAIYFKEDLFHHEIDIKEENIQISNFSSTHLNIIVIYRSQSGNLTKLKQHLEAITTRDKPELIIGDFNFDYTSSRSNPTNRYFEDHCYRQLINEPTHIEGNILDHAYCKDIQKINMYSAAVHCKYFTDHRGLAILVKQADKI